jgi:8-oxo-dGTP pyrophosphatase MutT (NUDIX family)
MASEPRTGKTWFPAGSVTTNEELVDAAVRELHEETCLILTPDDLTLLSDARVTCRTTTRLHLLGSCSCSVRYDPLAYSCSARARCYSSVGY